MAQFDISAYNEVLKYDILPNVPKETWFDRTFLGMLKADASDIKNVGGKYYRTYMKLKTQDAVGGGPRGAGQTLPPHVNPEWAEHYVNLCRWYSRVDADGAVRAVSDAVSIVNGMTELVNDLNKNIDHQEQASFIGNGVSALAKIASADNDGTTTTYTCTNDEFWPGTRRLRKGLRIDSYDGTTGYGTNTQRLNSASIANIPSETTFTVTEGSAVGQANDYVFFEDGNGSLVDAVPGGLAHIIDGPNYTPAWESAGGATLQGLDGTSLSYWQAYVSSAATARALDSELLEDLGQGVLAKTGEQQLGSGYILFSQPAVFTALAKVEGREHLWMNKTEVVAGVKVVKAQINGEEIPWVRDRMCGANKVDLIQTKDLIYKAVPAENLDPQGFVRLTDTDTYTLEKKKYSQLGCSRRCSHGTCRDLTTSV